MHDRQLHRFRAAVRLGAYELTRHGFDEMEKDVLTGSIGDRQRDRATHEWKYVIEGRALFGAEMAVVVKWLPMDRMAVLTTCRI